MVDHVMERRRAIPRLDATLPLLAATFVYVLLLPLGSQLLNDPDTYSHIAVGRWIIENRAFPTGDPFSHTMAGAHWAAFEWGSQVILASIYAFGGWPAVVAFAAASIALAFGFLAHFLSRYLSPKPVLVLLLAAFVLVTPHLLARPHVFAFPIMVCWIGTLLRAVEDRAPPPLWLLAVMVLWANLHGSFTLGLALLAPLGLEALLGAKAAERKAVFLRWLRFGALAVVAGALTPYGPELMLVTYRTLALGQVLAIVGEWQPMDFSTPSGFELVLLAALAFALGRGLVLPPMRILTLLSLLHLALAQSRHADLLGLLGPLFLAAPLARHLGEYGPREHAPGHPGPRIPQTRALWPTLAASAVVLSATAALSLQHGLAPDPRITPAAAVAASGALRTTPVLNDYGFGGYLDFVGIRPFVDGRAEVYGSAFIMRHHNALTMQTPGELPRLLDQYRIGATLLKPGTPALALLDQLPGWRRIYADDVAVVHAREPAAP